MPNYLKEVKELAFKVREVFEAISARDRMDPDLAGYCQRASAQLFLLAYDKNIPVKLVCCYGHTYNLYCGYIIDITATQFGKKDKVWIAKANRKNQSGWWKPICTNAICSSIEELKNLSWGIDGRQIFGDKKVVKRFLNGDKRIKKRSKSFWKSIIGH
jgi:hypothetical protein